jgi:hypothetical protein
MVLILAGEAVPILPGNFFGMGHDRIQRKPQDSIGYWRDWILISVELFARIGYRVPRGMRGEYD